jgi:hypothetical protein
MRTQNYGPIQVSSEMIDWLCGVRLTSKNRGHHWAIVHPPGEYERGSRDDDDYVGWR